MNQKDFDQVVADFKAHCAKWPENVPGMVNALRHKMTSVEFGVSTEAAETAISDALAGKFAPKAESKPVEEKN